MKKTTLGLGAIALAASLSLTACGDDEGELAKEYCKIAKKLDGAKDDPSKLTEVSKELSDWANDNKDKKGDPDKFADAVKDECDIDVANPVG